MQFRIAISVTDAAFVDRSGRIGDINDLEGIAITTCHIRIIAGNIDTLWRLQFRTAISVTDAAFVDRSGDLERVDIYAERAAWGDQMASILGAKGRKFRCGL